MCVYLCALCNELHIPWIRARYATDRPTVFADQEKRLNNIFVYSSCICVSVLFFLSVSHPNGAWRKPPDGNLICGCDNVDKDTFDLWPNLYLWLSGSHHDSQGICNSQNIQTKPSPV